MNPFDWTPEHRTAFFFAALFGCIMGVWGGMGHFDPYVPMRWLHVGIWACIGTALGALGGLLRQMLRIKKSG